MAAILQKEWLMSYKKKLKIINIFLLLSLCNIQNSYAEEKNNILDIAWEKQNIYISMLENNYKKISILNDRLDSCHKDFFKNNNDENKNSYLKSTNEFSTKLLTMMTILNEAINLTKDKMKNNKKEVEDNLIKYYDSLDDFLLKEKKSNDNLIYNLNKGMLEIENVFCKSNYIKNNIL